MSTSALQKLQRAERLYEVGDYREARRLASALAGEHTLQEAERDRVRRILEATRTDPVVIMALAFSCCLLVYLVLKYAL